MEKNTCSEIECSKPAYGRGLCAVHYQKARHNNTLPPNPEKQCCQCGKVFIDKKWNSVYCSDKCCEKARYERDRKKERTRDTCKQCGVDIVHKKTDAIFCSTQCLNDYRNKERWRLIKEEKVKDRKPCLWCGEAIPYEMRSNAVYCSGSCKKKYRRAVKHSMEAKELQEFLEANTKCGICGTSDFGSKGPQIDHDHRCCGPKSSCVKCRRGVLCTSCNNGLGRFKDDKNLLISAALYLDSLNV